MIALIFLILGNLVCAAPAFFHFDDSTHIRVILLAVLCFGNAAYARERQL